MKKFLALLMAAIMLLSLCACGTTAKTENVDDISPEDLEAAADALEDMNGDNAEEATEPAEKIYELGEAILSVDGFVELTFDSFCFSDYRDNARKTPTEDSSDMKTAGQDKTFLFFSGTMKVVEESKEQHGYCLYSVQADYDNGYLFSGSVGVYEVGAQYGSDSPYFEPLTGTNIREIRGYVEVAEVVESNTDGSLLITFKMNNNHPADGTSVTQLITLRLR